MHLQSSSTLGTGRSHTNAERNAKLEDKLTRRAIQTQAVKLKHAPVPSEDDLSDSQLGLDEITSLPGISRDDPIIIEGDISMRNDSSKHEHEIPAQYPGIIKRVRQKNKVWIYLMTLPVSYNLLSPASKAGKSITKLQKLRQRLPKIHSIAQTRTTIIAS